MIRPAELTSERIASMVDRLSEDQSVRRALPVWGRVHVDRRLPFIVVYRRPADHPDAGTDRIVTGVASYLLASGEASRRDGLRDLLRALAGVMRERFGSFLIIEVWSEESGTPDQPGYRLVRRRGDGLDDTAEEVVSALSESRIMGRPPVIVNETARKVAPEGARMLFDSRELASMGTELLGIAVNPVWRTHAHGETYPVLLRQLGRRFTTALDRGAYRFTLGHTTARPGHYHVLGRRTVLKAVWEIDAELAAIGESFDPLLLVTPVNGEQAWTAFRRSRFQRAPRFRYRPLPVDPARLKHRLWGVRTERVEDPTLMYVFRDMQRHLDRQLTLLNDRNRPEFLLTGLQLYGGVEPGLLAVAEHLLDMLPVRKGGRRGARIGAHEFARLATAEIEGYREQAPGFGHLPEVRDDIYAGLMVSNGHVLVGSGASIPAARADALIQHEIGTHVVTYHNGRSQPFRLLAVGLPGYDELQEGLAVLAEYLVGGLDAERMRVLAARVVAVHMLVEGAEFVETFRFLTSRGFTQHAAFTITTRVYRGGGLTKDAMYLRGLAGILDYVAEGCDFSRLFIGKFGVKHIPVIDELLLRQVLSLPVVVPRYLERPDARRRLDGLERGMSVIDLVRRGAAK
jgi:uncharacterized protein (TIGR02421 family)